MARSILNGAVVVGELSTQSNTKGVMLDGADRPLITRGWDAFTSGNYQGAGRWGVFMEAGKLTFGAIPVGGFQFAAYNANSTYTVVLVISGADGTLTWGADTNLYRGGPNVLKTDSLVDASPAGLRTKHETGTTPTGGSSGEVRVGTDKLWVQDAGTWKSVAVSAAGAPSFASAVKWGTD